MRSTETYVSIHTLQGDSTDYDFLIEQLEQAQPAAIKRWLSALGRLLKHTLVRLLTEPFTDA